ncbi:MAG: hypothetical protein LUG18_16085, partial [Candidatus Azobacteroides sp.]|nr:hypothetical protein [Candidatus Azobacteroides sp.]
SGSDVDNNNNNYFTATFEYVFSTWCGDSYIVVDGLWYTGSNSYVHNGGYFDGADLGTFTSESFTLGGELQVWPDTNTLAQLYYCFDDPQEDGNFVSISLPRTGSEGNNSKHYGEGTVSLAGLANGNHTIYIYFQSGSDVDNNNNNYFTATFELALPEPELTTAGNSHIIVNINNNVSTYNGSATDAAEDFASATLMGQTLLLGGDIETGPIMENVSVKMFYRINDGAAEEILLSKTSDDAEKDITVWSVETFQNITAGLNLSNGQEISIEIWFEATYGNITLYCPQGANETGGYKNNFTATVSTGLSHVNSDNVIIHPASDAINVTFAGTAEIGLYSVYGQLLDKVIAENNYQRSVPEGIYLLTINNNTYKILVK